MTELPPPPLPRGAEALRQIRARLAAGAWPVGTKLPSERTLCAELGVGRSTLREALRTLVDAGVLRARQGDGTYVIATDELELAVARRLSAEEAHRVLEVRGALEVEAARLAATRATAEDLATLQRLLQERDDARQSRDDAAFLRTDLAWHAALAAAAHNPLLLDLYVGLDRAATYTHGAGPATPSGASGATDSSSALPWGTAEEEELHARHAETLQALIARDPERAGNLARRLIAETHLAMDTTHAPEPQRTPEDPTA